MGQVYRALDTLMKREVAIKTLHKDLVAAEPQYADRFLNEAIAAGGVTHQHVVKIHDYGVHDGQPYIVMEYLQGKSLHAVVLAAPLPIQRAVDILLSACAAVYFCHRHRIFHRDLKPSNIFLVYTEDHDLDHVVVLDFGVAKIATQPDLTKAGSLMGTPSFLAPESITAKNADPQSDQYSLGVLLYYALTRKLPFRASSDYELWQAIRSGVCKPPRELRPEIPVGLEQVIKQAMSVDPSARFANVHMLGRALLPFASPAGRRHWSTLFTAAPRPAKDPTRSIASILPPAEQPTELDLTRTRDAQQSATARALTSPTGDTTMDPLPTREQGGAMADASISISLSGEIDGPPAQGRDGASAPPPEPIEPPATPAAFAKPPVSFRSRFLNPRVVAPVVAVLGVLVVGVAIRVAARSPARGAMSPAHVPAAVLAPAPATPQPLPPPASSSPAEPAAPEPATPELSTAATPTSASAPPTSEPASAKVSGETKPKRRHSRHILRDEHGFPIMD